MRNTFLKWYPNAQLECCKASGHYPMIETPVALVAAIEKFLSAHSLNFKGCDLGSAHKDRANSAVSSQCDQCAPSSQE